MADIPGVGPNKRIIEQLAMWTELQFTKDSEKYRRGHKGYRLN